MVKNIILLLIINRSRNIECFMKKVCHNRGNQESRWGAPSMSYVDEIKVYMKTIKNSESRFREGSATTGHGTPLTNGDYVNGYLFS